MLIEGLRGGIHDVLPQPQDHEIPTWVPYGDGVSVGFGTKVVRLYSGGVVATSAAMTLAVVHDHRVLH
jgi:hypothetical protein